MTGVLGPGTVTAAHLPDHTLLEAACSAPQTRLLVLTGLLFLYLLHAYLGTLLSLSVLNSMIRVSM